jgi:AraC-like DNA-binding protein
MESLASLWRHRDTLKCPRAQAIADCTVALLASSLAAAAQGLHRLTSRMESFHKERIRSFVEAELQNSELDIAMISAAIGLSPRYIHRLFASEPLHLMQWVWARRLECCHAELVRNRAAKRAISEIAYSWGFNDPAHFSKVFRKHFGVSPREARATPTHHAEQKTLFV